MPRLSGVIMLFKIRIGLRNGAFILGSTDAPELTIVDGRVTGISATWDKGLGYPLYIDWADVTSVSVAVIESRGPSEETSPRISGGMFNF
jgi:hypothetical protein